VASVRPLMDATGCKIAIPASPAHADFVTFLCDV
jgi:hypothetical protein